MNKQNQLNLFDGGGNNHEFNAKLGAELRDEGMATAMAHANRVHENWIDDAYEFYLEFVKGHKGENFLTEDVRVLADGIVPPPPDNRAWGGIAMMVRRAGLIRSVGTAKVKNAKAHRTIVNVWQKIN